MNIIKIYGGLGNQMFQYAFGRAMDTKVVAFDTSWGQVPHDPPRPFNLDKLRTNLITVNSNSGLNVVKETSEQFYRYIPEYLKLTNSYFFGYWQNRNYFKDILPELMTEFKVRPEYRTEEFDILKAKIILDQESIALHIRRGDYLTKGHHLLPIEYYAEALNQVEGTLYVFSDDIPWCKTQFENAIFIDQPDYLSFELMRYCTHKITANSTFSLWAALLSFSDGKIFAPKRWRLNDTEENAVEQEKFIPDNWIRL